MWRRKLPLASNATLLTVTTVLFSSCLDGAELVLDESLLALTLASAELSEAAFATGGTLSQEWKHAEFFTSEPDQAVVAKKSGYCFVAFRGTTLHWADWLQNSPVGTRQACVPDAETGSQEVCCTTREGFWGAYNADYKDQLESTVRDCASSCTNKDECVVLTGHSQGASIGTCNFFKAREGIDAESNATVLFLSCGGCSVSGGLESVRDYVWPTSHNPSSVSTGYVR